MLQLRNFTPHPINIISDGVTKTLESEGIARVAETQTEDAIIYPEGLDMAIPIIKKSYGQVEGLPEPQESTYFIVSMLVAQASDRKDLFYPGEVLRNEKGVIVGLKSLAWRN